MRFLTLSNLATLLLSIYSHPFYRQEIADLQQLLHMKDRYVLLKMSRVVAPLPLFVSEELSNTFPAFRWYLGEPGVLFASSCSLVAFLTFSSSCSCRFPCNSGFTNMTFSPLVLMVHCCSKKCYILLHLRVKVFRIVARRVQQRCCTLRATGQSMFPSKNNKLLFLLYLIFKRPNSKHQVRYLRL